MINLIDNIKNIMNKNVIFKLTSEKHLIVNDKKY